MKERLLLRALAPLALIVALPLVGAAAAGGRRVALARAHRSETKHHSTTGSMKSKPMSLGRVLLLGALQTTPASLVLAFCFTPPVSAEVFRAWYCVSYAYDEQSEHSFLAYDLSVRCDNSEEHNSIVAFAWILVFIWPVGAIVSYAALLIPCRHMFHEESPDSALLRATAFLHRDYSPSL